MKRHVVMVALLLGFGLFLRLYNRAEAMYFQSDQGLLLLTSKHAVFDGVVPRVGPPISLSGAYLPPFMYYLVGLFMLVSSDPLTVAMGYTALNLVASLLLFLWVRLMRDGTTALIALFLVMIASPLIENGRSIWQAHPTFFFVTLYLFLSEAAFHKRNLWLLGASIFVYVVSIGFYPTPLLLLPYVVARTAMHLRSWLAAALHLGGMFIAVFGPWIIRDPAIFQSNLRSVAGLFTNLWPIRAYRLLPFYPFFFIFLAWWLRSWIVDPRRIKRIIAGAFLVLFVFGSMRSWVTATITHPRNDYPEARKIADTITEDLRLRNVSISDVGVHYFTPLDTNDYYAAPLYYLLHRSIGYPVAYTPLGNELVRGEGETRHLVYLVCEGFGDAATTNCVVPFLARWPGYGLVRTYREPDGREVRVLMREER